ncbi:MAG: hypothetical protein WA755_04635 [Candidatus Acidiferrales bacterium]
MMQANAISVLVVGSPRHSVGILDFAARHGCVRAASCGEAAALFRWFRTPVVLAEERLPDGPAYELMPCLAGLPASLFVALALRGSNVWLPAIYRGERCLGACGVSSISLIEIMRRLHPRESVPNWEMCMPAEPARETVELSRV